MYRKGSQNSTFNQCTARTLFCGILQRAADLQILPSCIIPQEDLKSHVVFGREGPSFCAASAAARKTGTQNLHNSLLVVDAFCFTQPLALWDSDSDWEEEEVNPRNF